MVFQYCNQSTRRSSGTVIAKCMVGNKEVSAIADSFSGHNGNQLQVIRIEGIGKPTIFGAMKFCAIVEMAEAIGAHFQSLGQIE